MLVVASGLFAMFFFNTLYIQRVLGFSPLEAGLAFIPFTIGIAIGAGLSQWLMRTLGLRTTAAIGLVLGSAGMLGLLTIDRDGTYLADVLPMMIPLSIGMGLTFVPVTLLATSGLQADVAGLASGLFNTSQQIGGALGLAILSTIAVNRTDDESLAGLSGAPNPIQLGDALVSGFKAAFFAGAVLLLAGLVLLLTMLKQRDLERIPTDEPLRVPRLAGLEASSAIASAIAETAVDRPLAVAGEVERVLVPEADRAGEVAEVLLAAVDPEVEEDRDEVAVGHRVDHPPHDRPELRALLSPPPAPARRRRAPTTSSGAATCRRPCRARRSSRRPASSRRSARSAPSASAP